MFSGLEIDVFIKNRSFSNGWPLAGTYPRRKMDSQWANVDKIATQK